MAIVTTLERGIVKEDVSDASPIDTPAEKGQIPLSMQISNTGSIWLAESMSLPREVLFLFVINMAQACTRA